MKHCPFCGAALSEEASFCPHCTASLIEKTEIKPYRTLPFRKFLPPLLAVLIFGLLLALILWENPAPSPLPDSAESSATVTDTEPHTTDSEELLPSTESDSHPTDLPVTDSAPSSEQTDSISSENSSETTDSETPTDLSAESETETEHTDPISDTDTETVTDTVTNTDTDTEEISDTDTEEETQVILTPETAPLSGTYTYKGVEWYYETPPNAHKDYPYEVHELAYLTGVNNLSPNGVYDVPETVHGKHVILVKATSTTQARYSLDSLSFRKSAKVFYFPPEVFGVSSGVLFAETALTEIYIAGDEFFLNLDFFKGDFITVYSKTDCIFTHLADKPLMRDACTLYPDICTWEEWDPSTLYPNS